MGEFTQEERERAAEQINALGWGASWERYGANSKRSELDATLTGSGILIRGSVLVPVICELNRANAAIARLEAANREARELLIRAIDSGNASGTVYDRWEALASDTVWDDIGNFLSQNAEPAK